MRMKVKLGWIYLGAGRFLSPERNILPQLSCLRWGAQGAGVGCFSRPRETSSPRALAWGGVLTGRGGRKFLSPERNLLPQFRQICTEGIVRTIRTTRCKSTMGPDWFVIRF